MRCTLLLYSLEFFMLLGDVRAVTAGLNDLPKAFNGIFGPRLLVRGLLDISQQLH
jgi:hypothetical protein